MTITEILSKVARTANKAEKIAILKYNRSQVLDEIFDYAYNPDRMFGITSNQFEGTFSSLDCNGIEYHWDSIKKALDSFVAKQLTGNAAFEKVHSLCYNMNEKCQGILFNILDKNLKIGISLEQYQKEVMGIKPTKFEVTLAQHLEDVKGVNPIDGTWFASRKCDGVRCVAKFDNGEVTFISRQGKEFTTLENLKPEVKKFLKGMEGIWYLDGELCKIDENGDEHFDQIVGECKKKNYTIQECCYQLFDICPDSVWEGKCKGEDFEGRYARLNRFYDGYKSQKDSKCFIKILEQEILRSQEDFDRWEKKVADGNWEGFMLRKNIPFEKGRTKNLLKVKKFHDAEYKVEGVEFGTLTTAEPGKGNVEYEGVTSLVITHKGNKVNVGSGLTKDQRKEWYAHPNEIVGKTICVKYFQESQDKEGNVSLRFPTLKFVYGDKRDV